MVFILQISGLKTSSMGSKKCLKKIVVFGAIISADFGSAPIIALEHLPGAISA